MWPLSRTLPPATPDEGLLFIGLPNLKFGQLSTPGRITTRGKWGGSRLASPVPSGWDTPAVACPCPPHDPDELVPAAGGRGGLKDVRDTVRGVEG